jgi:uncharacterized protein YndB with AHSA1/START domain
MKKIDLTAHVHVNAPLQTVFDYVSDLSKHPEWSGGELNIEAVDDSPIAVGKEYRSKGAVAVEKERPNQVTVSVYEPPNKFGFISKDADFGAVHHLFTFVAKDGGVLITRNTTLSLKPWMAPLFRMVIYPFIGKPMTNKSLARLKEKLG